LLILSKLFDCRIPDKSCSKLVPGEAGADAGDHAGFFFRHELAAGDPAAHAVQEFEPVLDRRICFSLPVVVALRPCEEAILSPVVRDIDLPDGSVIQGALESDFGFGYRNFCY
jgi:hypothetical protein